MATNRTAEELFVVLAVDPQDGKEKVCQHVGTSGSTLLIATSREEAERIVPLAQCFSNNRGVPVTMVRYGSREQVHRLTPIQDRRPS